MLEVTQPVSQAEYAQRRRTLMKSMKPNSILLFPSAQEIFRNSDSTYPFRQNSDFYYLTGFNEPESILALSPERVEGEYLLFNRENDPKREVWDGPRAGLEGARKCFHADQSFASGSFDDHLIELLADKENVYYPIGVNHRFDNTLMRVVNQLRSGVRRGVIAPQKFIDVLPLIHEMRLFKSEAELALLQKAIDITERAHIHAIKACRPGMVEYELEAILLYEFCRQGARFPAYSSIVGSGKNSCVLHYVTNDKKIADGDVVLIDAGAEYQYYAADITRTFPANGKFSDSQRAIYELVLNAQTAAIAAIKPGVPFVEPQAIVIRILTQGLIELGILKGTLDELLEKEAYFNFYMHRAGHWLGLDVHDAGAYRLPSGQWRTFEPGMVLTVEPGLYIASTLADVDSQWHNIGVRIEDNIVVTQHGNNVMSKNIPKHIDDIEALMRAKT